MKVQTGFQEPHTDYNTWDDIHRRAIAGYPHAIKIKISDSERAKFNGFSEFRDRLLAWTEDFTTYDQWQWKGNYEGEFTFYFKDPDIAAAFKLTFK